MLDALETFLADVELEDLTDEDAVEQSYDDWTEDAEDIYSFESGVPSSMAIAARFGCLFNAIVFTDTIGAAPADADDERQIEFIAKEVADKGGELSEASRRAVIANGLAHFIWRNGPIEAIHGGGGLEALSDGDMMRTNALVSHLVAKNLTAPDKLPADLLRLRRDLLDPRREWPTGETLWGLCEGFIGELVKSVNGSIAGVQCMALRTSPEHVYNFSLWRGLFSESSCWAGTPWWPYTVKVFIQQAQTRQPWEDEPLVERWPLTISLDALEQRLLEPLYLLDKEIADWTAPSFTFCAQQGKADWQAAGSPQL